MCFIKIHNSFPLNLNSTVFPLSKTVRLLLMGVIREKFHSLKNRLIVIPLVRISYKFRLFAFKRALNIQIDLTRLLKLKMRDLNPDARLEGFDEHFDEVLRVGAMRLLSPHIFNPDAQELEEKTNEDIKSLYEKLRADYEKNKQDIDRILGELEGNKEILDVIKNYWLVCQYTKVLGREPKAAKYYFDLSLSIDADSTELEHKEIEKIRSNTKRELRKLRSSIADRDAFKLSFSGPGIATAFSLVSVLFLVSGYLYNKYLLGSLGIEVSKFFSLGDYISSSIEGIRYSVVGTVIGVGSLYLGMHHASRKSIAQIECDHSTRSYFPLHVFLLCGLIFATGYISNLPLMYDGIQLGVVFAGLYIARYIAHKYFKEPILAMFGLVFVISFFAHLYATLNKEIHQISNADIVAIKKYNFEFAPENQFPNQDMILIASSSEFFIFRDLKKEQSIVIPRNGIISITNFENAN